MKTKIPFAGRCLWLCVIVMGISVTIASRLVELQVVDRGKLQHRVKEELIEKELESLSFEDLISFTDEQLKQVAIHDTAAEPAAFIRSELCIAFL